MVVIVRVIVMIDGDETGVSGIGSFGPVETAFDEKKGEHGIPVRRQPLPPLPLHVVVFYEDLRAHEQTYSSDVPRLPGRLGIANATRILT